MSALPLHYGDEAPAECSRAGCRASAAWKIEWQNPKIHRGTRRKTWLACATHREYLEDFLRAREFRVWVHEFDEDDAP